jgi:hypothetical protein
MTKRGITTGNERIGLPSEDPHREASVTSYLRALKYSSHRATSNIE